MSDWVFAALFLVPLIVAMVGLTVAALQPTRATVRMAAVALGLLPAAVIVLMLAVWALGR